jgi:hypothetical protein
VEKEYLKLHSLKKQENQVLKKVSNYRPKLMVVKKEFQEIYKEKKLQMKQYLWN